MNGSVKIVQSIFPHCCLLCGATESEEALCPACYASLPWLGDTHCPRCALPTTDGAICGHCLKAPPAFDRTIAAMRYEFPLDVLIRELKYRHQFALAPLLGAALSERIRHYSCRPDVLIAMPLHPTRLRERGFNQAVELAKVMARQLDLPLLTRGVARIRATPPQVGLPWKERAKSVRGAFSCSTDLTGMHVAVLDDVMTTGTSLHELGLALKKQGAAEISAWVVARTMP